MTTRELMDSLSETLLCDDRILSVPERDLLTNVLQRARAHAGARDAVVAETIAVAVGETIAQRAFGILGTSITQRLIEHPGFTGSQETKQMQGPSVGPPPPQPAGPQPPRGPQPPKAHMQGPSVGPPQPTGPQPPHGPQPPKAHMQGPSVGPPQPTGPQPPHGPQPPRSTVTERQDSTVAVMERPEFLPAQHVVLEEFLTPQELSDLRQYVLDHETDFAVSEVISPGVSGGVIDHNHRRSRVLMNLERHYDVIVNRIRGCLPLILEKLGSDVFAVTEVEAQITASNHGDFFRNHSDNLHDETASRDLTYVYFFHGEPKAFRGGDLRIYDSRWENGAYVRTGGYQTVVPEQNQIVFFPSSLVHEISPVDCPSEAFADSRFTVNGWFHR